MATDHHLIAFIIAAILTSMVIMGGVTTVYFLDKRRSDRADVPHH